MRIARNGMKVIFPVFLVSFLMVILSVYFRSTVIVVLFWFFLILFKVPKGFLPDSKISDAIPVNFLFRGIIKYLQDFIAPLFIFLKADYILVMKDAGDILSSGNIKMNVWITKKITGRKIRIYKGELKVNEEGDFEIFIVFNDTKIKMLCQNELD